MGASRAGQFGRFGWLRWFRSSGLALALMLAACRGDSRPGPDEGAGLVEISADPSTRLVAAGEGRMAVRVRVMAGTPAAAPHGPVNLVLVLDSSGSMEGEAIAAAQQAAAAIVDRLSDGDRLAVVVFGSTAEVLVPSARLSSAVRAQVRARLAKMRARGTTSLGEGLAAGLAQLSAGRTERSLDRIVLLSDGVANDAATVTAAVEAARQARVPIASFGLGSGYDETTLGRIAMQTGGAYRYLAEPAAVAQVLDEEVLRMQRLVARNVTLVLTAGPGVTIEEVPGLPLAGQQGGPRLVLIGDLAGGESRDVIVPLTVRGQRDGAVVELLDAVVTFDDAAGGGGTRRRDTYVGIRASKDAAAVAKAVSVDVETATRRAMAAGAILQAIQLARSGDLATAKAVLDAAEASARSAVSAHPDAELADLIERMVALRAQLPSLLAQVNELGSGAAAATAPAVVSASPAEAVFQAVPAPAVSAARESDNAAIRATHDHASTVLRHR